jgi:hypothetical protein
MFKATINTAAILSALAVFGVPAQAEIFKDKGGRVNFVPTLAVDEKQADGSIIRKTAGTGIGTADLPSHSTS